MEENKELRNKPKSLWTFIFDKGGRSIKWSTNTLFNKQFWEVWTATCKKTRTLDHQLRLYTKINSRWIKDLYVSHDNIKVLEENIGKSQIFHTATSSQTCPLKQGT